MIMIIINSLTRHVTLAFRSRRTEGGSGWLDSPHKPKLGTLLTKNTISNVIYVHTPPVKHFWIPAHCLTRPKIKSLYTIRRPSPACIVAGVSCWKVLLSAYGKYAHAFTPKYYKNVWRLERKSVIYIWYMHMFHHRASGRRRNCFWSTGRKGEVVII